MKIGVWGVLAALLLLAGCNQQALLDRMVPKGDVSYAKSLIAQFPAHDYDGIIAKLDPDQVDENTRATLEQMAALMPNEKPLNAHVVGLQIKTAGSDPALTRLTLEYQYPHRWLLAQLVLQKQGAKTVVRSVYFQPLRHSLEQLNRFTFAGKDAKYYAFFALVVAVPLFMLYALIACFRTPMLRRYKWVWVLFIVIGFLRFSVNWTTGAVAFNPVYFLLLGSAAFKSGVAGAWVLSTSLPLGAILFMLRRHSWLEQVQQEGEDTSVGRI